LNARTNNIFFLFEVWQLQIRFGRGGAFCTRSKTGPAPEWWMMGVTTCTSFGCSQRTLHSVSLHSVSLTVFPSQCLCSQRHSPAPYFSCMDSVYLSTRGDQTGVAAPAAGCQTSCHAAATRAPYPPGTACVPGKACIRCCKLDSRVPQRGSRTFRCTLVRFHDTGSDSSASVCCLNICRTA
jgi:hypothetical protein